MSTLPASRATAVVYPDWNFTASTHDFPELIHEHTPNVHVFAVGNGTDTPPLEDVPSRPYLTVLLSEAKTGFNQAVLTGLTHAFEHPAEFQNVIRLDTREHPVSFLHNMERMLQYTDFVVADLTLTPELMPPDTAEDYHDVYIMPHITSRMSNGAVRLSGAHGYMGFSRKALQRVLPVLREVQSRTDATWSLDTLAAIILSQIVSTRVVPIPADVPRNRKSGKCFVQLHELYDLYDVYQTVRKHTT